MCQVRECIASGVYHSALEMICDEAGFLLDEKAWNAINSVPKTEQGYAKAEEMVHALGIKDLSAFQALLEMLLKPADEDSDIAKEKEGDISKMSQTDRLVHPNVVVEHLKTVVETEITPQASATSANKSRRK